ncbi:MAG: TrkH family potassium uptake protein [Thermodesulfobacteriota bacterium]
MRLRLSLHIIGIINIILSVMMLAPLLISVIYKDGDTKAFIISFAVTLSTGLFLFFSCRGNANDIGHKEGFTIVAFSWISAAIFAALPFYFSGALPSFLDCLFESTSGLTTTGSSLFTDVETLQHGILFWRSMTHWIGGMGIVLLGIAILPFLGIGGMQIYRAEASSLSGEKFAPRIAEVAKILLAMYLLLNFISLVLFILLGMNLFDAFIHMFGTLATGGFSSKNASIGFYNSPAIDVTIVIIMFIGGTNFFLHYGFYRKGIGVYWENEEFRFFMGVIIIATLLVTLSLMGFYQGPLESLKYALFQVVSAITCTGYATTDYNNWPYFSQFILILLMFIGGSAGSTAGAIKCVRILLIGKVIKKEMQNLLHPHVVTVVKLNGKTVAPETLKSVMSFTLMYIFIAAVSIVLLTSQGVNITASIASVASSIGNVGFGLGLPGANYSTMTDFSKWVLIFDMIVGRLEIYTLLILFLPSFWRG